MPSVSKDKQKKRPCRETRRKLKLICFLEHVSQGRIKCIPFCWSPQEEQSLDFPLQEYYRVCEWEANWENIVSKSQWNTRAGCPGRGSGDLPGRPCRQMPPFHSGSQQRKRNIVWSWYDRSLTISQQAWYRDSAAQLQADLDKQFDVCILLSPYWIICFPSNITTFTKQTGIFSFSVMTTTARSSFEVYSTTNLI